jgi:hypothetical protein
MLLSERFLEYSSFEIIPGNDTHSISATFLILKVFKGFNVNSFDKKLIEELSKSFDNIRISEPSPNYTETFSNLPDCSFRYTWRHLVCTSPEYLTKEEFMNRIYTAYESCYEKSFISSVSLPAPA